MRGAGAVTNFSSSPTIINCMFVRNGAGSLGNCGAGAIENYSSSPHIINCTFVDNWSEGDIDCGTIRNLENSSQTITNSILWYYDDYAYEPHIVNDASSTSTVTFSNIDQDGYEGQNGNIRQDPMFYVTGWDDNGTPDDPSDDVWVGGDYHLQQDSPCIDVGDNSALPPDTTDLDNDGDTTEPIPLDLDSEPRIINSVVDMGAYEYVYQNPIDAILIFFDESVADGSLTGQCPGKSANGRLNALRKMLEMAGDLINTEGACAQLKAAMEKCDGDPLQPDFVTGLAASELYAMISDLMAELGCEQLA